MRSTLLERLAQGPLLLDGAMGTMLQKAGLASGHPGDMWVRENPSAIAAVHRAYLNAGSDLVISCTFGSTSLNLARHGFDVDPIALNREGAELARACAGEDRYVLGDIGPFGDFLEPLGLAQPEEVRAAFLQQSRGLLSGGVDGLLIETMTALDEALLALEASLEAGAPFVVVSFAFDAAGDDFRTMMGLGVDEALSAALAAGAHAVGANCGKGISVERYGELGRRVAAAGGTWLKANAGTPIATPDGARYEASPESMGEMARSAVGFGLKMIGGCCGTQPEHLAEMGRAIR